MALLTRCQAFFLFLVTFLTVATAIPSASNTARTPFDGAQPKRRGIAYNNPAYVRHFNGPGSQAQWCYNWDSTSHDTYTPFEYVAMLHSHRQVHTSKWQSAVERSARAQPEDPTHLLGFNEPDNCIGGAGGSCMSVDNAVDAWWKYMEPTKKLKEKMYLGSPSVTNGGGTMGLTWLREFLQKCVGCSIDFICVHWYDSATNVAYFKSHLNAVRAIAGGRPIWLTEFSAAGTDEQVKAFLNEVIPWMDESKDIARYAYFMAMPGSLLNGAGSGLSDVGKHFVYWRKQGSGFTTKPLPTEGGDGEEARG